MNNLRSIFCCSSSAAVDDGSPASVPERREVTSPPRISELNLPDPLPRGTEYYLRTLSASNSGQQHVAQSSSGDNAQQNVSNDELSPLPPPANPAERGADDPATMRRSLPRRHSTLPSELPSARRHSTLPGELPSADRIQISVPPRGRGRTRSGPSRPPVRSRTMSEGGQGTSQPTRRELLAAAKKTPFYTNSEEGNIDGLVRMKLNTPGSVGGVAELVLQMAAMVLVDRELAEAGCYTNRKKYSALTRMDDGTWEAESAENKEKWTPENGRKYIFATMKDGTIRIGTSEQGKNGHAVLAGYSPYVRYAGEVMFEDKRPVRFSPRSGTYMPPMEMSANAGFGPECECIDVDAWNDVK